MTQLVEMIQAQQKQRSEELTRVQDELHQTKCTLEMEVEKARVEKQTLAAR